MHLSIPMKPALLTDVKQRLRLLDVLERVAQIRLTHAQAPDFLSAALDLVLTVFDADRVYLLYPCDPEAASWSVPMERTRAPWPPLHTVGVAVPMQAEVAAELGQLLQAPTRVQIGPAPARLVPSSIAGRFLIQAQVHSVTRPEQGQPWLLGLHHCAVSQALGPDDIMLLDAVTKRIVDNLAGFTPPLKLHVSGNFRAFFEHSSLGMALIDPAGAWLEINDALCRLLNYSRAALGTKSWADLICAEDLADYQGRVQSLLRGTIQNFSLAQRVVRQDNLVLHVRYVANAVLGDDGTLRHIVVTVEDATRRQQSDTAMAQHEAQLLLLSRQSTHGMAALDRIEGAMLAVNEDGQIEFANASAREWLKSGRFIRIENEKLRLLNAADQVALSNAVTQALQAGSTTEVVSHGNGTRLDSKCWITVMPLNPQVQQAVAFSKGVALLVLHEPHVSVADVGVFLRLGYAMTAAEIRLASALACGLTPEDYAGSVGLKIPTVRSQLRSIFAKTGSQKQSDVVRLLVAAPRMRHPATTSQTPAVPPLDHQSIRALTRRLRHLEVMDRLTQISLAHESMENVLPAVLELLLEVFNSDRAWLLYPVDPDAPTWSIPMGRTRAQWPALGHEMAMTPAFSALVREQLCEKDAVQHGPGGERPVHFETAKHFSVKSQMRILLRPKIGSPWSFGLHHCADAVLHDEEDVQLFTAVAERVNNMLSAMLAIHELRVNERRLRDLFESAPVGLLNLSLDGRILSANSAMSALLGFASSQELVDANHHLALPVVFGETQLAMLLIAMRASVEWVRCECDLRAKTGAAVSVRFSGRQVVNGHGKLQCFEAFVEAII